MAHGDDMPVMRQPDDPSGAYSRRCLCCNAPGAHGADVLCHECRPPAPWWAHLTRWVPCVKRRWF